VPRLGPADAAQVGPYLDLARGLGSFLVQTFPGALRSLRLSVQGGIPPSAHHALTVAALLGALRHSVEGTLTPVNAERVAADRNVRVHCEASTMKRDFMSLLRVEVVLGDQRHFASGTVLGQRHGRLVELDGYVLDAIPEGPMLVTFHQDRPGVVGRLGTVLGDAGVNISRMQIGSMNGGDGDAKRTALGILNLDGEPDEALLERIRSIDAIERACLVR
jgi:D-3-phosphoglycerate dehydrogenase / 2-oxoglutarate reductase